MSDPEATVERLKRALREYRDRFLESDRERNTPGWEARWKFIEEALDATEAQPADTEELPGPYADPQQQRCKRCGRADGLNAIVPDAMWERIRGGLNVLCLWCMDAEAKRQGIKGTVVLHFAGRALFSGLTYLDGKRAGLEGAAKWHEDQVGLLGFSAERDWHQNAARVLRRLIPREEAPRD